MSTGYRRDPRSHLHLDAGIAMQGVGQIADGGGEPAASRSCGRSSNVSRRVRSVAFVSASRALVIARRAASTSSCRRCRSIRSSSMSAAAMTWIVSSWSSSAILDRCWASALMMSSSSVWRRCSTSRSRRSCSRSARDVAVVQDDAPHSRIVEQVGRAPPSTTRHEPSRAAAGTRPAAESRGCREAAPAIARPRAASSGGIRSSGVLPLNHSGGRPTTRPIDGFW